jgi:hypothetical protein
MRPSFAFRDQSHFGFRFGAIEVQRAKLTIAPMVDPE